MLTTSAHHFTDRPVDFKLHVDPVDFESLQKDLPKKPGRQVLHATPVGLLVPILLSNTAEKGCAKSIEYHRITQNAFEQWSKVLYATASFSYIHTHSFGSLLCLPQRLTHCPSFPVRMENRFLWLIWWLMQIPPPIPLLNSSNAAPKHSYSRNVL